MPRKKKKNNFASSGLSKFRNISSKISFKKRSKLVRSANKETKITKCFVLWTRKKCEERTRGTKLPFRGRTFLFKKTGVGLLLIIHMLFLCTKSKDYLAPCASSERSFSTSRVRIGLNRHNCVLSLTSFQKQWK